MKKIGEERAFDIIKKAGFDAVDYNFDEYLSYSDVTHQRFEGVMFDGCREYFSEVKKKLDASGLAAGQAHAPFPTYLPGDDRSNEILIDVMKRSIEAAAILKAPYLVIHPRFNTTFDKRFTPEEEYEVNRKFYLALADTLRGSGVTCCLENMWTCASPWRKIYADVCGDPSDTAEMIDKLNAEAGEDLFGYCYDVGHSLICGLDPYRFMLKLGKRIKVFHIHDVDGVHDSHLLPFLGVGEWRTFARGVAAIGYDYSLNLEAGNFYNLCGEECYPEAFAMMRAVVAKLNKMVDEERIKLK
ncbi:MAG: sugar phosphate isomerase/epimerase [Clostridia bacterium]|nr:sugar phosphate isomerase/epimerase [Clostridia bacterium]